MPSQNQIKASALKKARLLPAHYHVGRLTESQKRHVRRLWVEYSEIASAPTEFIVKKATRRAVLKAKESGFAAHNNLIFVPREPGMLPHSVVITDDAIVRKVRQGKPGVTEIIKTIESPLIRKVDFFLKLDDLRLHRPLRAHEYITVRIGGAAPFRGAHPTYDALERYVSNWFPRDYAKLERKKKGKGVALRQELIEGMDVVRFHTVF